MPGHFYFESAFPLPPVGIGSTLYGIVPALQLLCYCDDVLAVLD